MQDIVVMMGVAGSGKTTVGRALPARLGVAFCEGDDLHPAANTAKMRAGAPLTDDDRAPWLAMLADGLRSRRAGDAAAFSAARRCGGSIATGGAPRGATVRFVLLDEDEAILRKRLERRCGHSCRPRCSRVS